MLDASDRVQLSRAATSVEIQLLALKAKPFPAALLNGNCLQSAAIGAGLAPLQRKWLISPSSQGPGLEARGQVAHRVETGWIIGVGVLGDLKMAVPVLTGFVFCFASSGVLFSGLWCWRRRDAHCEGRLGHLRAGIATDAQRSWVHTRHGVSSKEEDWALRDSIPLGAFHS